VVNSATPARVRVGARDVLPYDERSMSESLRPLARQLRTTLLAWRKLSDGQKLCRCRLLGDRGQVRLSIHDQDRMSCTGGGLAGSAGL